MPKQIATYAAPVIADPTPAANQIPMYAADGSLAAAGAGFLGTGAALSTILQMTGTVTLTTTATLDGTKTIILLDASGGVFTTTLVPAASMSGQFLFFLRTSASNLPTLKGNGSELINGANTYTGLSAQYKGALLWSNGTQWYVLLGI